MVQWLILILFIFTTACSQQPGQTPSLMPVATFTPAPITDPAELSQASLAALVVERIEALPKNDPEQASEILDLISVYRQAYLEISTDDLPQLNTLEDALQANPNYGSASLEQDALRWQQAVTDEIAARETLYMNISSQPGAVANNRVEAFIQAHDFVDSFLSADGDGSLSPAELETLAQLSANAEASLANTGDPPLILLSRQIDQVMRLATRGDWPQARQALAELKRDLPRRPEP